MSLRQYLMKKWEETRNKREEFEREMWRKLNIYWGEAGKKGESMLDILEKQIIAQAKKRNIEPEKFTDLLFKQATAEDFMRELKGV